MVTTETTLEKPVDGMPDQQVDSIVENSGNVSTAACQDAADILSILDGFGGQHPTTKRLPKDIPLTAREQDKLADLLGDTRPKAENNLKQTESLKTESDVTAEGHGNTDKSTPPLPSEIKDNSLQQQPSAAEHTEPVASDLAEQDQTISDDSFSKAESQIEALTAERDAIGKELSHTKNRVNELQNDHPDNKTENNQAREIEQLRFELSKISKWHESLTEQVQKLLKIAEKSDTERESIETDLGQAHETICKLHKQLDPLQEKLEDYDNTINQLRAQLVEQSERRTTIHEKLQLEVSQRRKAEKMLSGIKLRLTPLTKSKSVKKIKSSQK